MEDEITKGKQGESQGETPSSDKGETTSQKAEKKFSEKDVQKKLSDQAAQFGRERANLTKSQTDTQAALQSAQTELDSTTSRLDTVEKQIRESKLNKDDPQSVTLFQDQESLISEKRELEKGKRFLLAERAQVNEERKSLSAQRIAIIADRYGADVADLESLGTDNIEVVERYAKAVGKKKEKPEKGVKPKKGESEVSEEGEEGDEWSPDSSTGKGESDDLALDEDEQEAISTKVLAQRMKKRKPDLLI